MPEHYDNDSRMAELMRKFLTGKLSARERTELKAIIDTSSEKRQIFEELKAEKKQLIFEAFELDDEIDADTSWHQFKQNVSFAPEKVSVMHWLLAAACILAFISIAGYFIFGRNSENKTNTFSEQESIDSTTKLEKYNAVLKLGNGQHLVLDDIPNDTLAYVASVPVLKYSGELAYPITVASEPAAMDTLETLRGGYYHVRLSDGTRVWLSSLSKLIYPHAFDAKERTVVLEGVAYFEIAKDPPRPFKVKTEKLEIEALGTKFNVSAYKDEKNIKTSLFEGSVKLKTGSEQKILKPGEQAIIPVNGGNNTIVISNKLSAFNKGHFSFFNEDFQTILREISKAYGYSVSFNKSVIKGHWNVNLYRNLTLAETLDLIKSQTKMEYTITSDSTIVIHK